MAAGRKRDISELEELEPRTYTPQRVLGKGSFGLVCQAVVEETGEVVAIKSMKTKQPEKVDSGEEVWRQLSGEKDLEVQILKELQGHPNILSLRGAFLTQGEGKELKLNLVLEYMSDTLHRVLKHYMNALHRLMDVYYVKLYQYHLLRGLAFMHGLGIMHCDIKPQNLLLDGRTHTVKIADFGTAKRLAVNRTLTSYACSRYYRAPELILGATSYNTSVDLWSAGCVLGEMLLGQPLFTGADGIDQLVQIVKVLGTPSAQELKKMNPNYPEHHFQPRVPPVDWDRVFKNMVPREACELTAQLLKFDPDARLPPLFCLMDRFFDALRQDDRKEHKPLFEFLPEELWWCTAAERERLIPRWMREEEKLQEK